MAKKIAATAIIVLGIFALYNNLSWFMRYIYPLRYEESIVRYSVEHGVDPYLVISVIKVESNFSPKVVSKQGAIGLMQLMPKTALWAAEKMEIKNIKVEDLQNPDLNIRIGAWYLASLLDEFNGNITLALAAYNGGRGNVAKWIQKGRLEQKQEAEIPFPETRNFVTRVKKSYKWYKRLYKL
ncbi:MAG TPA: lytic transglycosylase domain-containing protein [Thermoanaerobacterales bacterium]|nr:lytic transglycosylase domain-containing protein [Thermoanaerobacterales bacterium]